MTSDDITRLLQRFAVDPWSTGDLKGFDDTVAEGYVLHPDMTLDDLKGIIKNYRRAFPDLTLTVEETITEGQRVAYRWVMRGTHQGEIEGIAPTGKPVTFSGITILRLESGKVVEDRYESSSPDLQQQLGVGS